MSRFIAVIHGWHVHSNGFTVRELRATTIHQAQMEACYLRDQREKAFDSCAVTVVEIESGERLARRLTWHERITGRAKP
jgi:hypothetical protein